MKPIRSLCDRKRLTPAAIRDYVQRVHLYQSGETCQVQDVEMTLDWTVNPRSTDQRVAETRRYAARVVTAARSYWITVALWRLDGVVASVLINDHGDRRCV